LTTYGNFRRAEDSTPYAPPSYDEPGAPPEAHEDGAAGRVRAWSDAWLQTAAQLRLALAGRTLPSATPVIDGQHRDLLWQALRRAERRLIIASPEVDATIVDGPLGRRLAARLEAGVAVTICYARTTGTPDQITTLTELSRDYPELMHLR